MTARVDAGRREFLRVSATLAGGMLISVALPRRLRAAADDARPDAGRQSLPFSPDAFIRIDPDGTVTITVARPELGEGVRTSLAALVCEELDADFARVRLEQADYAATRYGPQWSGGSSAMRQGWEPLRRVGAAARAMLIAAAAAQWGVSATACSTEAGVVRHPPTGRALSYGALAGAAAALAVPADVPLKPRSAYRLIGTRIPSLDAPAIVRGEIQFGLDQRVPGMLVAVVERSPRLGSTIASLDSSAAKQVAGVRDVIIIQGDKLPSFGENNPRPRLGVAVVATNTWAAMQGRKALRIEWVPGPGSDEDSAKLAATARTLVAKPADRIILNDGDVTAAMAGAAKTVDAVYEVSLLAHTPMELMNCVADCRPDRCTVWAPIQNPEGTQQAIEKVTGLAPDRITVHVVRSGGAFGRRFYSDFVAEAVILSRAMRAPVQVVWTREDDVRFGFYRPWAVQSMRAGLSADGSIAAWTHHFINAPRGEFLEWEIPKPYTEYPAGMGEVDRGDFPSVFLPNFRLEATRVKSGIPLGQWRAVDSGATIFAIESFFDEVAHAAGRDFLELKLASLGDRPARGVTRTLPCDPARLRAVYALAAARGDWGKPLPSHWGRGIAGGYNNGTYVAEVAEVEIIDGTTIAVRRIVAAVDCGTVVNRSGAGGQVEGAIIYGLSAALKEKITIVDGAVQQSNFHDFPALRLREVPKLEVHFVPSDGPALGLGEGALPAVAPAVANAIFAATGRRLRSLPLAL